MAEFKHLVRIADTDLRGNKTIYAELQKIKGVGSTISRSLCLIVGVAKNEKTGNLTDEQIKKFDSTLKTAKSFPSWMLNRKKDHETGEDKHLLNANLNFQKENDIKLMRKIKSYKGVRHGKGLTVRGQKTKSNSRKSKSKLAGRKKKR